jgi:hypothetical protein
MCSAYAELAACARRIAKDVGEPDDTTAVKLTLSGRTPNLPVIPTDELLRDTAYDRLEPAARSRISSTLEKRFSAISDRYVHQFRLDAEHHYSLESRGIPDAEVESSLIGMYENRYRQFINDIRIMLAKLLARSACTKESRNPRGGFGDVSPTLVPS